MNKNLDQIITGFVIGAIVPVVGYYLIDQLFSFLSESGIMDEVSGLGLDKRKRTMALMAICCNILPIQIFKNKHINRGLKGILFATFAYAAFWLIAFGPEIFSNL